MRTRETSVGRYRGIRARLGLIFIISVLAVMAGCTYALAESTGYYSEMKSSYTFAFSSSEPYTCKIGAKRSLTGAVEIPAYVVVKKGDGVSLPAGVDQIQFTVIEVASFGGRDITSVTFPAGLQKIGEQAFLNCKKLTGDIVIPDSVTYLGNGAFSGCTALNGKLVLGKGLTKIKMSTFSSCAFTGTLTIPSNITAIGAYAFQDCKGFTGDLTIPAAVKSIGYDAFKNCSGFDGTLHLLCTEAKRDGRTFSGCSGFTGLEIAEGITGIGYEEFYGCKGLTGTLKLPESITSFEYSCFRGCTGLTGTLVIPSKVTIIDSRAFNGCTGFTSLTLPEGLLEVEDSAFEGCTGLTGTLNLPSTLTEVGDSAFLKCGFTGSLTLPEGLVYMSGSSFACPNITGTLTIPSTVATIPNAFLGMYKVAKIVNNSEKKFYLVDNFIAESDKESYFVLSGTTEHLTPYSYDTKGRKVKNSYGKGVYLRNGENPDAFGTPDFPLPASVIVIEDEAFVGSKAGIVEIPSTCTSIGARVFMNSLSLKQIRIPAGCSVGEDAFEGCGSVQIFGTAGSPAETYCSTHSNCTFVAE